MFSEIEVKRQCPMYTGAANRLSRVLITGPPGLGKTTICKKLVALLEKHNSKFDGFYTEEVRGENNSRIGFDVVLVKNPENRSPLARAENVISQSQYSKHRVGKYHVFLETFETTALSALEKNVDILIIDEIGKMELLSRKFREKIEELFCKPSKKIFLIATIPERQKEPQRHLSLFDALRANKESKLINVNRQNRDGLPEEILGLVLSA